MSHVPPTEHITCDAVVVGARVAGAATAMLLARSGLRVLVVDRSAYGADTLSTHALMRAGVVQLDRWGLLDRIVDAGTPAVRRTTFRYGNEVIPITVKPSHGIDALYAPRRTVLDPVLVEAATAAGAEVRFGVTVTDVRRDGRGRVVGVDATDVTGRPLVVDAGIVIGADGRRSVVAERVQAPVERLGANASAIVYGYWSDVEAEGYEWIFQPHATAGLIPTNDGLTCVFAGSTPERIGRGGRDVLEAILREAAPDVAERVAAGVAPLGVRSFPGAPGWLRRAWGPGWALVGDAGYWKDPLGAHGLTDALRDAELLARAVVAAAGGSVLESIALSGYQAARDRLSVSLFEVVDEIAGYGWDGTTIGPLLLQLSAAMADEVDTVAAFGTAEAVAVP